jgi:hypothetical protein
MMPFMGAPMRPVASAPRPQNFNNMGPAPVGGMPPRFQGPAGGMPPRPVPGGLMGAGGMPTATPARPIEVGPRPGGPLMGSFKKGGKVKKTGVYKLHAGERVLNKKQTAKLAPIAMLLRAKKG